MALPSPMKTADFFFELPSQQIAQYPTERRSESRLLVVHRLSGRLEHRMFFELPGLLDAGDLLVLNDTRVIPARVSGHKEKTGGKVEFLFLEEAERGIWDVLMRCSRRPRIGDHVVLEGGRIRLELLEEGDQGRARVKVQGTGSLLSYLDANGQTPLPPYIQRESSQGVRDKERYQTVYATHPGAVAAPTAGLHFDDDLFLCLEEAGVERTYLTLHVGLGTFRAVTHEQVEDHEMEAERYSVSKAAACAVQKTKMRGGRVVAVGSTSVRTLETVADPCGTVSAGEGRTNLFIYAPYDFKVVNAMVTNFHLPQSTLLMMVSSFAGTALTRHAYDVAVKEKYRFFSYGDCMLIL